MARAGLRKGYEDSGKSPSVSREGFAGTHSSSAVLGVPGECSRGIERHWSDADNVQNGGRIGKGYQTNSGFSARWTTHRFVRGAPRLKLQGGPAALENRAGCSYSTFSAIIAQNSIVPDTHQTRR